MDQTDKICPLLSRTGDKFERCLRFDCAWWDHCETQCALLSFRDGLSALSDVLTVDIVEK